MSESVEAPSEEAPAAEVAPEAEWVLPEAPSRKFRKIGGYWVREFTMNNRPATEIICLSLTTAANIQGRTLWPKSR